MKKQRISLTLLTLTMFFSLLFLHVTKATCDAKSGASLNEQSTVASAEKEADEASDLEEQSSHNYFRFLEKQVKQNIIAQYQTLQEEDDNEEISNQILSFR